MCINFIYSAKLRQLILSSEALLDHLCLADVQKTHLIITRLQTRCLPLQIICHHIKITTPCAKRTPLCAPIGLVSWLELSEPN